MDRGVLLVEGREETRSKIRRELARAGLRVFEAPGNAFAGRPAIIGSGTEGSDRVARSEGLWGTGLELALIGPGVSLAEGLGTVAAIRLRTRIQVALLVDPGTIPPDELRCWCATADLAVVSAEPEGLVQRVDALLATRRAGSRLTTAADDVASLRHRRQAAQRAELVNLLEACGGNLAAVARHLGMSRSAVAYRARKFGLLPCGVT